MEKLSTEALLSEFPRTHGVAVYCGYSKIPGDPNCLLAERVGRAIGATFKDNKRLFVVTGGGERSCNMGAVAHGAVLAGSKSIGIPIPFDNWEPPHNDYQAMVVHPNFPLRIYGQNGFEQHSSYTVVLPGGVGTAWELINKAQDLFFNHNPFPSQRQIILVDHNNHFTGPNRLIPYLKSMVADGLLKPEFLDIFTIVKTPEDVPAKLMDKRVPWVKPREVEKSYVLVRKSI